LELRHHGQSFRLPTGRAVSLPIPPAPALGPRPSQPAGRAPVTG